jgi:hypothetical protein
MNIFAEQLVDVLAKHQHELSNLFTWRQDIPPSAVVRLKASLTTDQSATLNTDQIDFLADKYGFDEADHRRLRAALLAEAVRKMLAGRMDTRIAYRLGLVTLDLLLSDDPDDVMQAVDELVTQVRDLPLELRTLPEVVRGIPSDDEHGGANHPLVVAAQEMKDAPVFDMSRLLALNNAEEAYHQGLLW